jgi:hypothetical protein
MFVYKIRCFETEQTIEIKKHIFFNFFYFKIIKIHLRNILKTYLFYIFSFIFPIKHLFFPLVWLAASTKINPAFVISFASNCHCHFLEGISSSPFLLQKVFGYRYCRWRNWLSNLKGKWKSDFHICVWIHGRRTVLQGWRVGMTLWGEALWMPISTPYGLDLVIMIQYHIADLTWIII